MLVTIFIRQKENKTIINWKVDAIKIYGKLCVTMSIKFYDIKCVHLYFIISS